MAEVRSADGDWNFDGDRLRITPGEDRRVHKLRRALGELAIPTAAIDEVVFTPTRKAGGTLHLRMREGADPLGVAAGGQLPDAADPYRLAVDAQAVIGADFLIDTFRAAAPDHGARGPVSRFLVPSPPIPVQVTVSEAVVAFDGRKVRIDWGWQAPEAKRRAGAQDLPIEHVTGVVWRPMRGLQDGVLRFDVAAGAAASAAGEANAVRLTWGTDTELLTVLVAGAVLAALGDPVTTDAPPPLAPPSADLDALTTRLRALGELHRDGVLTDEEFTLAKQAVLRRMAGEPG